jgi:hypothetical protein
MPADEDDELVEAIASDVMACLYRIDFLGKLDNVLCADDGSTKNVDCSGDFKHSERLLAASGFDSAELEDIFRVLRSKGGYCDCEILYNAVDSSRLKSQYWKNRVNGVDALTSHHKSHE